MPNNGASDPRTGPSMVIRYHHRIEFNCLKRFKVLENECSFQKYQHFFYFPYKSREISGEFYYLVEKFVKKAQKIALIVKDY